MNKYTKEEQNLVEIFNKRNSTPSKKFEKNLDKAMQDILLTQKRGFFASFSFYAASMVVIIMAGVLSASFLYIYTNSSQQSGNNIRILSDSEKSIAIQNITKNNINFLKVPEQIEQQLESEENTKINKTKVVFEPTIHMPVCTNQKQILEYNIYTYTEAGSVYVKEELITTDGTFEKITKDNDPSIFYTNAIINNDIQTARLFESDQLDYTLSQDSVAMDNLKGYIYRSDGEFTCVTELGIQSDLKPISYTENGTTTDAYVIEFERDIYINNENFKITSEIIRAKDTAEIYVSKYISTSQLDATVNTIKSLFRIE